MLPPPYVTCLPLGKPCIWIEQLLLKTPALNISAIPPVLNDVSVRQGRSLPFQDEKTTAQLFYILSETASRLELRFPDSPCSQDVILSPTPPSHPNSVHQIPHLKNPFSPGLICCLTHAKGSEGDSSVLLAVRLEFFKKCPLSWWVAGSVSLFAEMFLFYIDAREKGRKRGMDSGITQNGLEWDEGVILVHSAIVYWAPTMYHALGARLPAEGFSGERRSVSWPHGTESLLGTCCSTMWKMLASVWCPKVSFRNNWPWLLKSNI